ncbi:aldose epimerase family protein [Flavobacterium granuli]|uniref:Aldose 1-epimerase n=1 Tax=Flavobacterium granuli TaxID=280093 RepID=A0ABU1S2K4_9FLAO|nr:aldose epimerase family protein [Flavobacterium granuli]MDR6845267.1 aldose 1-epimerase [Flavobacterium granuli]
MKLFGITPEGKVVNSYELTNKRGATLKVINYGATVTSLKIPLKKGGTIDVVLGFDTLDDYIKSFDLESAPYLGTTVGRYAGRIGKATFNINGQSIHLDKNNNENSLHGGNDNFSKKVWEVKEVKEGNSPSITFVYLSPANESNYPGELTVELTYVLTEENELLIKYSAKTTEDTVVNLTHHSYFNLDGHLSNISNQELIVNTHRILEVSPDSIPTGRFLELENTDFDFFTPKKCPSKIDNTFVLDRKDEFAASLFNKNNNLKMTVYTDQPGVHIYVGGNCFNTVKGKENADYHPLSGICFETQNFPDAPNHEHFPNATLKKGEKYSHNTIYKFQSF